MTVKAFRRYSAFLLLVLLVFFMYTLGNKIVIVSGKSMQPTLCDGYWVTAKLIDVPRLDKVYMLKEPENGALVIKRLVGVPGDKIEFRDGALYRNDILITESGGTSWDNMFAILGEDEYLFVGDNRAESYDGRSWSRFTKRSEIEYELRTVIKPLDAYGDLR